MGDGGTLYIRTRATSLLLVEQEKRLLVEPASFGRLTVSAAWRALPI